MMATTLKHKIFTQHSRSWQGNRYVYPVISRRSKGLSIGINLNPDKVCNFDCVYCCVDRTVPPAVRKVDLGAVRYELDQMLALGLSGELFNQRPFDTTPPDFRRLNDVAFSGDGEPTAYPRFEEACHLVADMLQQYQQDQVKIVLITNATLLHRPNVIKALDFLDQHNGEIWAKLDAGTDQYYKQVTRTSVPLSRVLRNIADSGKKRPLVIQSLFLKLNGQGPSPEEVGAYVGRLKDLTEQGCQIKLVQIYTVARGTAVGGVQPLDDAALDSIAAQVRALGLAAETYYGVR